MLRVWLPLVLVLAAAAGVVFLFLNDPLASGVDEAGDHEEAAGSRGEVIDGGAAVLDPNNPSGPRKPRGPREEDEPAGPPKPTFPPSEGVAGRVVDANRRPIADATVTLHPFPQEG